MKTLISLLAIASVCSAQPPIIPLQPQQQINQSFNNINKNAYYLDGKNVACTGSGTANAITCSPLPATTGYNPGMTVTLTATANNTGATTLNVGGFGPVAVLSAAGAPLTSGQITSPNTYTLTYTGGSFLLSGGSGSVGPAGPAGPAGAGNNAYCADTTGSTALYTCPSPSPTVTTLTGLFVSFVPQTTNATGTSTLNVANLGAKTMKQPDCLTNVSSGALIGGLVYSFAYNGTSFCQSSTVGTLTGSAGGALSGTYPNPVVLGITQAAGTTTGPTLPGTAPAGTIGVTAPYSPNDVRNAVAYGADPTNTSDSSTAVNAAAAAGPVYFPCGTYKFNTTITLSGPAPTIRGEPNCVTLISTASPPILYQSVLQSSVYDSNMRLYISDFTLFSPANTTAIQINRTTIPTPPSFQANLVGGVITRVNLVGLYSCSEDSSCFTATVPTVSALRAFGAGIACGQCSGFAIHDSIIRGYGIGIDYEGDEGNFYNLHMSNGGSGGVNANGNDFLISPAFNGTSYFAQGNNNVIGPGNKMEHWLRAGSVNLQNALGSTKIFNNYFENYCLSATFLVSVQSQGTNWYGNESDNTNVVGNCPAPGSPTAYTPPNLTPLMVLDDTKDILVHNNHLLGAAGSSVITLNHTYGNNQQYYFWGNTVNFPVPTGANTVTSPDLNPTFVGNVTVNGTHTVGSEVMTYSGGALNFSGGNVAVPALFSGGVVFAPNFQTSGNCSSIANPAVCGSDAAGSFIVAAAATSATINTTAVTANSQILITFDASLGSKLGVTCNTTIPGTAGVSARSSGQIVMSASAPVTNPACFSYLIIN